MKQRDDRVYLQDICDAIDAISKYLTGVDFHQFEAERMRQDAVVLQFAIIGEAVTKLSRGLRATHPEIPWNDIAGMRHRIVHEYFEIRLEVVWDTAHDNLPEFREQIGFLLVELDKA